MGLFDYFTGSTDKEQTRAPAQQTGPAPAAASNQAAQGRSGGVMGWFQSAGSWVADTWHDTTAAVGGFVNRAGEVVKDTVDVVRSTSLSYQDGRIGIETDLDEVMDLMPDSVREKLQLDRNGAANRMRLEVDTQRGGVTLSSDDLAVAGVRAGGLQTGAVHMKGVRIDLSNPGAGLPFVDVPFLGGEEGPDNPSAAVSVASIEAENINYQGASGPVALKRLSAGNLSAHASAREGMPFGGGKDTTAGFSVENAVVDGLAMSGVSVDHASADRASAGLFGQSETAFLETEGLTVNGARQGDRSLGDARVGHARVDVRNQGGGLPMLDDQADHLDAEVVVSAADVHDFRAGEQGVGQATLAQFRALYNQDRGRVAATADGLQVAGVDTEQLDVASAGLGHVEVDAALGADANKIAVRADTANARGVALSPAQASNRADSATKPLDWSVALGSAQVSELSSGTNRVGGANLTGLNASGHLDDHGLTARGSLERGGVTGLHTDLLSAGALGVSGVQLSTGDGRTTLGAASAQGDDLVARNFATRHMDATGANLVLAGGSTGVTVDHAGIQGARIADRLSVNSGTVDGLVGNITGERRDIGFDRAHVAGVRDAVTAASVGGADLSRLHVTNDGQDVDATLAGLAVRDAAYGDQAHLDAGNLTGIRASLHGEDLRAGFQQADATGLRARNAGTDTVVASLAATDGSLTRSNGATHIGLETGAVTGVQHGDIRAAQIATHGATVDLDARGTSLGATGVQVDDFAARNFSAGQLAATNTAVRLQGDDMSASLDHARLARARVGDRLAVDEATVEGLDASVKDGRRAVTVDAAHLANAVDTPTNSRVREADLAGLSIANQGTNTEATLASLGARGLSSGDNRAASLSIAGLRGSSSGETLSGGFQSAEAQTLHLATGGTRADVGTVSARDASLRRGAGGTDASLGQLSAADVAMSVAASTGRSGGSVGAPGLNVDTASLVRSVSARVDDARLNATVPLRAGDIPGAPISVRDNTVATANLSVTDNQLDRGTNLSLSRGLDGPLWVGVNGAHMDDRNRLMVDVSGWKDQNASEMINEGLGLPGKSMHSLGTLGDAAARRMGQPSTGSNASQGGAMDLVDMANLRANGSVGFSAGTIDAGQAGQLTLANGTQAGDNTVNASLDRDRIVAGFSRVLAGSFSANTGDSQIAGGQTTLSGADVTVNRQTGAVQADLDAIEAARLRYHGAR